MVPNATVDPFTDATDPRPVHFMGIAGAGMSALAELCARRGVRVTGCDANPGGATDLVARGITPLDGHDASHVSDARAVVYSSAIAPAHPELLRAAQLGIPVIRRAEALALAVRRGRTIGIAGTHGKSTTTVMAAEALAAAGFDPTALVGARVAAWDGNMRRGAPDVFVVEADEYDRSFLALAPEVAVVTNIEADHLDIYSGIDDIRAAFAQYIARARYVVLCADDANANAIRTLPTAEVVRYGLHSSDARLVARDIRGEGGGSEFSVWYDGAHAGDVLLHVPGRHNVLNALAALAVGLLWGARVPDMAAGLARFAGVERRFQRIGEVGGVTIVDDYAHHPTEIAATLAAARSTFPGRRIVIAFQPHLFSRTRDFATEFGTALAAADVVFVTDIYAAREQPVDGVTSALVVGSARRAGAHVAWEGPRDALARALAAAVRHGDVVLTVGAGDVTKTGAELMGMMVEMRDERADARERGGRRDGV